MTSTAGQEQSGTIPPGETPDGAPAAPGEPGSSSLHGGARHQIADRVFRSLAVGSGFLITLVIALIAIFLLAQAIPSLAKNTANFFTYTGPW